MVTLRRQFVTIREIPGRGWLWLEHGRQFATLAAAVKAVKKDAYVLSKDAPIAGFSGVATVITYEPVTPTGTAVVKALTASD
jgi:hypothetical protein